MLAGKKINPLFKTCLLYTSTIKELYPFFHENGALIFQAHPFRDTMTVTSPKFLDGIEAGNFCTTHDSRNDIAAAWAKKFGMLTVYGSDYHLSLIHI